MGACSLTNLANFGPNGRKKYFSRCSSKHPSAVEGRADIVKLKGAPVDDGGVDAQCA